MKQQQFTVDQYQAAKVVAKELGINFVGKTKQTLVDLVNTAVKASIKPAKKEKWSANGYGYEVGQTVVITSKTINKAGVEKEILQNRKAIVQGPSFNENFIIAFLIDDKTNEVLKCPVTLDIAKINPLVEEVKELQTA